MKTNRYKADLSINEYYLDKEIIQQPQKYYEYAYKCAQAQNEKEDAKDKYDIIKIKVESKIRKSENKPSTEGAIKTAAENNKKVQEARLKFIEARQKYNLLSKAEEAFKQRKSMLQTYVYYKSLNSESDIKVPSKYQKDMHRKFSNDIRSQLNLNKKKRRIKF